MISFIFVHNNELSCIPYMNNIQGNLLFHIMTTKYSDPFLSYLNAFTLVPSHISKTRINLPDAWTQSPLHSHHKT